jgi:hypothetical protein
MLQSIYSVLHSPSNEINLYVKSLEAKILRVCTDSFSQEDFFKDADSALSEGD